MRTVGCRDGRRDGPMVGLREGRLDGFLVGLSGSNREEKTINNTQGSIEQESEMSSISYNSTTVVV